MAGEASPRDYGAATPSEARCDMLLAPIRGAGVRPIALRVGSSRVLGRDVPWTADAQRTGIREDELTVSRAQLFIHVLAADRVEVEVMGAKACAKGREQAAVEPRAPTCLL